MNYTPRYTYWLYRANVRVSDLPNELTVLIQQFDKAFLAWQEATDQKQQGYRKIVEQCDAFISAKLFSLFEKQINEQNESDTLKDLLDKAADLDF